MLFWNKIGSESISQIDLGLIDFYLPKFNPSELRFKWVWQHLRSEVWTLMSSSGFLTY